MYTLFLILILFLTYISVNHPGRRKTERGFGTGHEREKVRRNLGTGTGNQMTWSVFEEVLRSQPNVKMTFEKREDLAMVQATKAKQDCFVDDRVWTCGDIGYGLLAHRCLHRCPDLQLHPHDGMDQDKSRSLVGSSYLVWKILNKDATSLPIDKSS